MHGIELPYSCGGGVCGVCLCEVKSGAEAIQEDLITTPIIPLAKDENGNPKEILACIAGIKPEMFQNSQPHTIILKRQY
jgi:ferredoxin